jgi:hypothetical protein
MELWLGQRINEATGACLVRQRSTSREHSPVRQYGLLSRLPRYTSGAPAFVNRRSRPHIGAVHLDLSDEEAAALAEELHNIVESDRYPFSPRIRTLRAILAELRPEPVREPSPPLKVYAPPSKGRYKRRRG